MEGQFEQLELKVHLTASKREQAVLRKDDDIVAFNSYLSKISPFSCLAVCQIKKPLKSVLTLTCLHQCMKYCAGKLLRFLFRKSCWSNTALASSTLSVKWWSSTASTSDWVMQQTHSKDSASSPLKWLSMDWDNNGRATRLLSKWLAMPLDLPPWHSAKRFGHCKHSRKKCILC